MGLIPKFLMQTPITIYNSKVQYDGSLHVEQTRDYLCRLEQRTSKETQIGTDVIHYDWIAYIDQDVIIGVGDNVQTAEREMVVKKVDKFRNAKGIVDHTKIYML